MATNFPGGSTKTLPLPSTTAGPHDGHAEGRLNCVALRHGWSRNFSIPSDELVGINYSDLESVLEINTLKLRTHFLRIYIEHPPESGHWSKVRFWKHDGSLQSVIIQEFFAQRLRDGVVTRFEIRDGSDRQADDALSLKAVGSRGLGMSQSSAPEEEVQTQKKTGGGFISWFRERSRQVQPSPRRRLGPTDTDEETAVHTPVEPPSKLSFFGLLRPHPKTGTPNPVRRLSIFDFFRTRTPRPVTEEESLVCRGARETEIEALRKGGWLPPLRTASLRDRLTKDSGVTGRNVNPFFGGSISNGSLSRRSTGRIKKKSNNTEDEQETVNKGRDVEMHDPFDDSQAVINSNGHGPFVLSEADVDEYFEVERASSVLEVNNRPGNWSRFRPANTRRVNISVKGKNKRDSSPPPVKGQLGGGADIVQRPRDAFPNSPYHRVNREAESSSS